LFIFRRRKGSRKAGFFKSEIRGNLQKLTVENKQTTREGKRQEARALRALFKIKSKLYYIIISNVPLMKILVIPRVSKKKNTPVSWPCGAGVTDARRDAG
jgi:hypothetical protein